MSHTLCENLRDVPHLLPCVRAWVEGEIILHVHAISNLLPGRLDRAVANLRVLGTKTFVFTTKNVNVIPTVPLLTPEEGPFYGIWENKQEKGFARDSNPLPSPVTSVIEYGLEKTWRDNFVTTLVRSI